jgi:hypothetical protein
VHITGNELAMVSAGVAAVAVVASVANNRSTNKNSLKATKESNENALRIAREERVTRLGSQIFETRRTLYGRYLAALSNTVDVRWGGTPWPHDRTPSAEQREALKTTARARYGEALLIYEELAITAPAEVAKAADETLVAAGRVEVSDPDSHLKYSSQVENLRDLMRKDLGKYQPD